MKQGIEGQDPRRFSQPGEDSSEVRVIHNVRPARRGFGALLLLVVLLAGLVVAGYYYFFHLGSTDTLAVLEAEPGNLLGRGWSFEPGPHRGGDASDIWDLKRDRDTYFSLTRKDSRSGLYALTASMPEGGLARAFYLDPIPVHSRRQYTASAWVKVTGGAMVSLKARFLKIGGKEEAPRFLYADEFVSDRERTGDFVRITGTVFPPPEADEMVFCILAAGKGEVVVDDLSLMEETSTTRDQLGTSGVMDFFSCNGGYLLRRIDETLYLGGRIVAQERPTAEGAVEASFDTENAGFLPPGGGYLFAGQGAGLIRINRSLEVNAQTIQGEFSAPAAGPGLLEGVRYCFDLLAPYAAHGVGVLSGEEFTLYESGFPARPADALILGGDEDRVRIRFKRPTQVAGVDRREGGVSVQCLFDPSQEIHFAFEIFTDFTEETLQALGQIQQAERAQEEEHFSAALAQAEKVLKRYPYNASLVDRAEKLRASILERKREMLSQMSERLRSAEFLDTPDLFLALERTCRSALERFPEDRDFMAMLERVQDKGKQLLESLQNRRAERFYLLAENLKNQGGREATLSEILKFMETEFPDNAWTLKARSLKPGSPQAEPSRPESGAGAEQGKDAGASGG